LIRIVKLMPVNARMKQNVAALRLYPSIFGTSFDHDGWQAVRPTPTTNTSARVAEAFCRWFCVIFHGKTAGIQRSLCLAQLHAPPNTAYMRCLQFRTRNHQRDQRPTHLTSPSYVITAIHPSRRSNFHHCVSRHFVLPDTDFAISCWSVSKLSFVWIVSKTNERVVRLFMAAVRSRCGHYIFALWFLLSFFLSFFFSFLA